MFVEVNRALKLSDASFLVCLFLNLQVVHRDVAARNMLVNHCHGDVNKKFYVKIGDFGLARVVNEQGVFTTTSEVRLICELFTHFDFSG